MRRATWATHGSPDVIGQWRGHGLRTDRAANLVQLRGVRYRESCPAKTVPSGRWVRTQNRAANSLQNLDRASLRRGLRHVSGVVRAAEACKWNRESETALLSGTEDRKAAGISLSAD